MPFGTNVIMMLCSLITLAAVYAIFLLCSVKQVEKEIASEIADATVPVTLQDRILSDMTGVPVGVVLPNGAVSRLYVKNGKLFRQPTKQERQAGQGGGV